MSRPGEASDARIFEAYNNQDDAGLPELLLTELSPVQGTRTRGASLAGRCIKLKQGPDLFGNSAFTVLIDFRKDREDDEGWLVCFDGSFEIFVSRRGLQASVWTDRGERTLRSAGLRLAVNRWYRLGLTFSGRTGAVELSLDGESVCAAGDLKDGRQVGNLFADLCIGSPRGESFTGRIDSFKFLDAALPLREMR